MNLTEMFFSHFDCLEDPREDNYKVLHKFHDILVIAILGTICRADGWTEICQFAEAKIDWLETFLDLSNRIPSHDTFGRVFSLLDLETFEACFLAWIESLSKVGITARRKRAGWDNKYLLKVLMGDAHLKKSED